MARISLKEAYDNRDVIAWLVKHEDEIDELMDILKDINPSGDLTNIVTKTGDQTIDGIKTFIGKIVADCDIIQNGGNYETHAEQVYTTNDYIVMRDGAVSGLGTGQFSGFQVKKYNGSDDGRLVIDNTGVARVGDIGDEQPLMTRDESSAMADGGIVVWDAVNNKAKAPASNAIDLKNNNKDLSTVVGSTAIDEILFKAKNLGVNDFMGSRIQFRRYSDHSRFWISLYRPSNSDETALILEQYDNGRVRVWVNNTVNGTATAHNILDSNP